MFLDAVDHGNCVCIEIETQDFASLQKLLVPLQSIF